MAALTGTLAQSKDLYVSGTVNQLSDMTANAAETVGWCVDEARGEVDRITGIGGTLAGTAIATGLTTPKAIALSADETALYVLQNNGVLLTMDPATGASSQLATLAGTSTQWNYLANGGDGYLYCASTDHRSIHRININSLVLEVFLYLPYWATGLGFSADKSVLYTCISPSGVNQTGPLCKITMAQGRYEIVAGLSTNAQTNGEAFLISAFSTALRPVVDSTGTIIYLADGTSGTGRLCTVTGGQVTRINVGTQFVRGQRSGMWMLRTANKLLCTNGSTQVGVVT